MLVNIEYKVEAFGVEIVEEDTFNCSAIVFFMVFFL